MVDPFLLGKMISLKTENKNITETEIAAQCNCSQTTVSTYLTWYYNLIRYFNNDEQTLFLFAVELLELAKDPIKFYVAMHKSKLEMIEKNLNNYYYNKINKKQNNEQRDVA